MVISGKQDIEVIIVGAVISVAIYWFVRKQMRYKPVNIRTVIRKVPNVFRYVGILIWETAKANLSVLRIVFSRSVSIKPRLVYLRIDLKSDATRVVLANSITLTPGTITAEMDDGVYCIHCLDEGMSENLDDSIFVRELKKFEE